MKLIKMLAVVVALTMTGTEAVNLEKKSMITGADDPYLTKVFHHWDQAGIDAEGKENGKRVLIKDNAERAAKEVCAKWKGLKGKELEDWAEANFPGSWKEFGAGAFIDVRDAFYWMRQLVDTEGTHTP